MAVDMFLTLDGVKGESEDKNHPKQIGVLSWSWGMSRSGSAHVGGGPPASAKSMAGRAKSPAPSFELPRREYSGLEGFCGALTVIALRRRRPKRRLRG
jgi:hypothetical protein